MPAEIVAEDNPREGAQQELVTITIANINNGACAEQFSLALEKVLANIVDPSTIATAARAITMQVIFKPHSDRIKVETEVHVATKLASCEASRAQVFLGRTEQGGIVALDADPRQMLLWKAPAPRAVPPIPIFGNTKDK